MNQNQSPCYLSILETGYKTRLSEYMTLLSDKVKDNRVESLVVVVIELMKWLEPHLNFKNQNIL